MKGIPRKRLLSESGIEPKEGMSVIYHDDWGLPQHGILGSPNFVGRASVKKENGGVVAYYLEDLQTIVIEYEEKSGIKPFVTSETKFLPLPPSDFKTVIEKELFDKEVEFEIKKESFYDESQCCKKYEGCEHFVEGGIGECLKSEVVYNQIAKLLPQEQTWDDIIKNSGFSDLKIEKLSDFIHYLKFNFHPPCPKSFKYEHLCLPQEQRMFTIEEVKRFFNVVSQESGDYLAGISKEHSFEKSLKKFDTI